MRILGLGIGFFVLAFIAHLAIWRIKTPVKQIKTLLKIFFGIFFLTLFALNILGIYTEINVLPNSFPEYLQLFILYVSLVLAYLTTYSAMDVDSPSLVIVMSVAGAGDKGLTQNELDEQLTDGKLIVPRVDDLIRDGLAYADKDKYKISKTGATLVKIIIAYRNLINAPKGG